MTLLPSPLLLPSFYFFTFRAAALTSHTNQHQPSTTTNKHNKTTPTRNTNSSAHPINKRKNELASGPPNKPIHIKKTITTQTQKIHPHTSTPQQQPEHQHRQQTQTTKLNENKTITDSPTKATTPGPLGTLRASCAPKQHNNNVNETDSAHFVPNMTSS
jgi:hypothetical protein